jgi:hypothetical protein
MSARYPTVRPRRAARRAASLLLLVALGAPRRAPADEPTLRVEPSTVDVGLGFHGARVRVTASVPAGASAVFRLVGPARDVSLNVKGRVAGILWATVASARFAAVPAVLLVRADRDAPPDTALRDAGLLPEALETQLLPESASAARHEIVREMLRLFRKRGSFAVARAAGPAGQGPRTAEFDLPPTAPAGRYVADVTFFRDGRIVDRGATGLELRTSGVVVMVLRLAMQQGLWYGLGAVVVAVLAGLLTDVVFRRGAKGGH